MLKKYDLHDRTWQLVVNRDESHDRSEEPVAKRDTLHELTRTCWVQIVEYTTIGLRLSGHGAAEANLTEELRHAETSPTCEIHESCCTSH